MGARTPDIDLAAEVFDGCQSSLCKSVHEETCNGHSSSNLEKTPCAIILEDIDTLSSGGNGCMTVEELGISLSGILHIEDSCETFGNSPDSNHFDVCGDKDMQSPLVDTNTSKFFSTCEAIACSEAVQSCSLTIDVNEGSSSTVIYVENSLTAKNPRDACLTNLPVDPKLVSALKGSRIQQGITHTEKLSVRWAPDVYDPPVTSESRTVRGHSQRSKVKKDLYKHRHKGKSSRGSGGDKKNAHRRSTSSLIDPRILRLRALEVGSLSKGYGGTELNVLSYAARSRSSCYTEPVPCVHLSVTEAS